MDRLFINCVRKFTTNGLNKRADFICFHKENKWPLHIKQDILSNCFVASDFINKEEELGLIKEIEPHMKRLRYEKSHWDDAIYLYREREQKKWKDENESVIKRIVDNSIPPESKHLSYIHILDLHEDGHIKPHIDSVRYCGNIITGVSLLSDCIMRLKNPDGLTFDLFLEQRSLYRLSGLGRYEFTHEILGNTESVFNGRAIHKGRRISVICRDIPEKDGSNKEKIIEKLELITL